MTTRFLILSINSIFQHSSIGILLLCLVGSPSLAQSQQVDGSNCRMITISDMNDEESFAILQNEGDEWVLRPYDSLQKTAYKLTEVARNDKKIVLLLKEQNDFGFFHIDFEKNHVQISDEQEPMATILARSSNNFASSVGHVTFGNVEENNVGYFAKTGPFTWVDDQAHKFRVESKDAWSIRLIEEETRRPDRIHLDFYNNQIKTNQQTIPILNTSFRKVDSNQRVNSIGLCKPGYNQPVATIKAIGRGRWEEKHGSRVYSFKEVSRQGSKITLTKANGGSGQMVIDLTSGQVTWNSELLFLIGNTQRAKTSIQDNSPITKVEWITSGGGEVDFSITRFQRNFVLKISSAGYRPIRKLVLLTPNQREAYDAVKAVFDGEYILKDTPAAPNVLTGTWTTISITRGNDKSAFRSTSSSGPLRAIYDFAYQSSN